MVLAYTGFFDLGKVAEMLLENAPPSILENIVGRGPLWIDSTACLRIHMEHRYTEWQF